MAGEFAETIDEELGACVDVLLGLEDIGEGVDMVEDASSFAMGLVLDGGKDIGVSAEVLAIPNGIEVSLVQASLVPVNLSDGVG